MLRIWSNLGRLGLALSVVLAGLLALGAAQPAQAADFRTGSVVVIAADEVIDDDLFASGERVEVNGTIKGDLFATGGEVVVNGTVEGSLMTAAQSAEVNGRVDGSTYGTAYALQVGPEAVIGRNLYFGGYSLETAAGSNVGRSLYVGGYQAILGGEVAHDVRAGPGALELNGTVDGDVYAEVGDADANFNGRPFMFPGMPAGIVTIEPGLRLGPDASIKGNVWYQSAAEAAIPAGVVAGTVTQATPEPEPRTEPPASPGVSRLQGVFDTFSRRAGEFIALMIVGGLLLRFWPSSVRRPSDEAQMRPLRSAGWGLLVALIFFVAVPLAAIAVFAAAVLFGLVTYGQLFGTVLGLGSAALGLTVTVFWFVLSLLTKVVVGYLVGRLVLQRAAPAWLASNYGDLLALATGVLAYEVLRALPLGLGWLIGVVVTLLGLGAIYFVVREALRRRAALPAPVAA
jgi:hypothetical protein